MNKFKKLLSFATAAALSVSAFAGLTISAGAEGEFSYERGTAGHDWSDSDIQTEVGTTSENLKWTLDIANGTELTYKTSGTTYNITDPITKENATAQTKITDYGLYKAGGNGSNETKMSFTTTPNSKITVDAVWLGMSNTGRAFSASNASYFRFGNIWIMENDQDQDKGSGYSLSGFSKTPTLFTNPTNAANRKYDVSEKTFYDIHIKVDTAKNVLEELTIKEEGGSENLVNITEEQELVNPDYTTVAIGLQRGGSVSTYNQEYLKSIKITEEFQTVSTANYTVAYVDSTSGEAVKDSDTSRGGIVDDPISLRDEDTQNFKTTVNVDGTDVEKKYIYVSDDSEGKTITSEGTTITVKFREAEKIDYTISANINNNEYTKEFKSGSDFEGETETVAIPKYIVRDGIAYIRDGINDNTTYKYSLTLPTTKEGDVTEEIKYNKSTPEGSLVAFFGEGEDILTTGKGGNSDIDNTGSMADGAKVTNDGHVVVQSLPAGSYKLYAAVSSSKGGGSTDVFGRCTFTKGAADGEEIITIIGEGTKAGEKEFTLTEDTAIYAKRSAGGRDVNLDYILIERLNAVSVEEVKPDEGEEFTGSEADDVATAYKATITLDSTKTYTSPKITWKVNYTDTDNEVGALTTIKDLENIVQPQAPLLFGLVVSGKAPTGYTAGDVTVRLTSAE